jgi:hypothetical protein
MQIRDGFAQDADVIAVAFMIYHGLVFGVGGYKGDGITIAVKVLQSGLAVDEGGGDLADLDGRLLSFFLLQPHRKGKRPGTYWI